MAVDEDERRRPRYFEMQAPPGIQDWWKSPKNSFSYWLAIHQRLQNKNILEGVQT